MELNLNVLYGAVSMGLHCVALLISMCYLIYYDSERIMWLIFARLQNYLFYASVLLVVVCFLRTTDKDLRYQYVLSCVITAVFTYFVNTSYTRNALTMIVNQISQVSLKYYVGRIYRPYYEDLQNEAQASENEGKDAYMEPTVVKKRK